MLFRSQPHIDARIIKTKSLLGSEKLAKFTLQDLTYTAIVGSGKKGNLVSIEYTAGATAGSEVVSVVDEAISIQIEDGVSDADEIKAAFDGDAGALALATVAVSGVGGNAQDILSPTNLLGGLAAGLKSNAFIFQFRPTALRIDSRDMDTIDFEASGGTEIEFEQGGSTFTFAKADVRIVRRLRTRKYGIEPTAVVIV